MAICEVCSNDSDKTFRVELGDDVHVFDSLECAIHILAPECPRCGIKILGHGIESGDRLYCCKACARVVSSDRSVHQRHMHA